MKKFLSLLVLVGLFVPYVGFGQVATTVSKVVNPVIKKYTPPVTDNPTANSPATVLKKSKNYDPLVALLQAKLTNLGTDPGPVDGVNGTKTTEALKEVQRFFGMKADGIYGRDSQKLFSILPLNSSLRTTDPLVAIALKKYVKEQMSTVPVAINNSNSTSSTALTTIPFTPKGITQVLSSSLALPGFSQVSQANIAGTTLTSKPKITASGQTVALYSLAGSVNQSVVNSSNLNTNFSTGTSASNAVYVCGVVQKTSVCVPVPKDIAEAINKGSVTLEQYLSSKSAGKDTGCITCFLDSEGNLGVITGSNPSSISIPPSNKPNPSASIVNMCMDYPYANTNTAIYEITFSKPVKVINPASLSLDLVRYYNAPSKKVNAKYVSSSYDNRTLRFSAGLPSANSIYFEGEGRLKISGGAKVVTADTGETLDLDILPDTFRLSNPCGTSREYDVVSTNVVLNPDKLYAGESFAAPRLNVEIKFREPVLVNGNLRLVMNPTDTGGTSFGSLVSSRSQATDTLVFHFNAPVGARWDNILGAFAFDPNSGSLKNQAGKTILLNIQSGQDSTGGTCELKYIGNVCVEWSGNQLKYQVSYSRDIVVKTNGSNANINLVIKPLNSNSQPIVATLSGYDTNNMYFTATPKSNLLSDHVGTASLDIKNGASVRTIATTLQSLGHDQYGGFVDPDLGIFTATCSGETESLPDICASWADVALYGDDVIEYKVKYSGNVTADNKGSNSNIELIIDHANPNIPNTTAVLVGVSDNTLHFVRNSTSLQAGFVLSQYTGQATLNLKNSATVKVNGVAVGNNLGSFNSECIQIVSGSANYRPALLPGELADSRRVDYSITFNRPVAITGAPTLKIKNANGAENVEGTYLSGSGTSTLKFHVNYPADVFPSWPTDYEGAPVIYLNGGSIKDLNDHPMNLTVPTSVVFKYTN